MIKLADTLAPMADFPAVEAKDVAFNDNKSLQEKYDNGELGGGSGSGEENKIDSISVNGSPISIDENKNVDITVPSIEGLTKDADLATVAKSGDYEDLINKPTIPDAYDDTALSNRVKSVEDEVPNLATKTYVGEQIANAEHLKREIVTVIPSDTEASDNIIYMLKVESTTGNDKYQEYMKIDGTVQMVGDTSVDLTDYAKIAEIPTTVAELSDSGDYAKITDIQKKLDKTFTGADVADKVLKTDSLGNVVLGTYDDTISDTSTNAVQNKAIKTELDKKFDIAQSVDKAGYVAVIGDDGNMTFTEPTTLGDKGITLTEAEYLALPEEEKLNNSYYLYDIGVHYKNGVAYSRKKPIQLTMEEYKALGEVDPDQEYIVSADEQGILLGAEDISYSNAVSNLSCTTVQGAIDKVVNEVIRSYFYPTGVITDIEIGENGAKYIAPSDGFVQVTVSGVVSEIGYASIITSNPANSVSLTEPTGNNQRVKTFVKKGEEYMVYYSVGDNGLITLKHYALV